MPSVSSLFPANTALPEVALVGRPNVGKSTLFNRLLGHRRAVVSDIPGTTRDRLRQVITWKGVTYTLTDMAGIEPLLKAGSELTEGIQQQVERALADAQVIIWVVDATVGITAQDDVVANMLRRLGKPVVIAANKCDAPQHEVRQFEFSRYGFSGIVAISALHARGTDELSDAVIALVPTPDSLTPSETVPEPEVRLTLVGRPNVGKSTLLNAFAGETRAVVSAEAGTTRDAVDTVIPAADFFGKTFTKWHHVRIVDTAGFRRRGKIGHRIEAWSVVRSLDSLDQADIALLLLDGTDPLVHQDLQVAQKIVDAGRGLILLINKWDAVLETAGIIPGTEEDAQKQEAILDAMRLQAPFLYWAPVLFLSAKTKLHLEELGRLVRDVYVAWSREPSQADLDALAEHIKSLPHLEHLRKITLEHSQPPTFHIHTHGNFLLHFSLRRQIEGIIRDYCDIGPTPVKLWVERER